MEVRRQLLSDQHPRAAPDQEPDLARQRVRVAGPAANQPHDPSQREDVPTPVKRRPSRISHLVSKRAATAGSCVATTTATPPSSAASRRTLIAISALT